MLKNYVTIAFRNLYRHKLYTLIHICSLALGITACLLVFLFVRDELNYNRFHEHVDSLYRVIADDAGEPAAVTPPPLGPALKASLPEVIEVGRLFGSPRQNIILKYEDKMFYQSMWHADPSIMTMFSFPLVHGESATALQTPESAVLGATAAQKFFGNENPVGRQMLVKLGDTFEPFTIEAVLQIPDNSSIQFDILLPMSANKGSGVTEWYLLGAATYIRLSDPAQIPDVESKLQHIRNTHISKDWPLEFKLQPLSDMHLSRGMLSKEPTSSITYSYILTALAMVVLFIACVNFMTLTIGRSTTRFREIGMRKVFGAQRSHVMLQFWGEALTLSFLSLILGIVFTNLVLPIFNQATDKMLTLDIASNWTTLTGMVVLMIVVGLLAGSYPSMVLSRYQPVQALTQRLKPGGRNLFTRGLVVIQFALSSLLITSAIIMSDQMAYIQDKDLGFNREQVVVVNGINGLQTYKRYRAALETQNNITGVAGATGLMRRGGGGIWNHHVESDGTDIQTADIGIDYDYLPLLEIDLIEGRNFSRAFSTDPAEAVIVNRALVEAFEWDTALGRRLTINDGEKTVIGVLDDFYFLPLLKSVTPLVMKLYNQDPEQSDDIMAYAGPPLNHMFVKIRPDNITQTLADMEQAWYRVESETPFDFTFLDEYIDSLYRSEQRWHRIVTASSAFAIFISCLGLFGLAALVVAHRTREIGIRKVLGSSVSEVVQLISREFLLLVAIANLIAWPVAYVVMNRWLEDFAYRITPGIETFLIAGASTLIIAWLTVSTQAFKAARTNPVDALHDE